MTKRNFIYLVILVSIIITINSGKILEFYNQSSLVNALRYEVSAEEDEEDQELIEEVEFDEAELNEVDLESLNRDTYIIKEGLNQEYINNTTRSKGEKIAYLTFDDGPSPEVTLEILEILKAEEVTATFFVLGENVEEYPYILERIHREGHVIGNHTYSHNYKKIYKNTDMYMEDLLKGEAAIKAVLGADYDLTLTRFPGGSFGKGKEAFRRRVNLEGYVYIDWNSLNGDGEGAILPVEYLLNRFKSTAQGKDVLVVLMHDISAKYTTVDTLPEIITYLKERGYSIKPLPQYIETEVIRDNSIPASIN